MMVGSNIFVLQKNPRLAHIKMAMRLAHQEKSLRFHPPGNCGSASY
nr:MAG TPA: hypothetical protein [Caudoviricetes sp.]